MKKYEGEWPEPMKGRAKVCKDEIVNAIMVGTPVVIEQSDHPTLDLQKIANLYRNNVWISEHRRVETRVLRGEGIVLMRLVDEGEEF